MDLVRQSMRRPAVWTYHSLATACRHHSLMRALTRAQATPALHGGRREWMSVMIPRRMSHRPFHSGAGDFEAAPDVETPCVESYASSLGRRWGLRKLH